MKKYLPFNVNQIVYVKLTDKDIQNFLKFISKSFSLQKEEYIIKRVQEWGIILEQKTNDKGYTRFQLHDFIEAFGETIYNGNIFDLYFEIDNDVNFIDELPK